MLSLCALRLTTGDEMLTSAALAELNTHVHMSEYAHHVAFLRAVQEQVGGAWSFEQPLEEGG